MEEEKNILMEQLGQIYQDSRQLEEQSKIIEQQIRELQEFESSLKELEESKKEGHNDILTSLGKGVFLKTEVKNEKLFVDVGSGVFVRKEIKDAKEIISDQLSKLVAMRNEVHMEIEKSNSKMQKLMQGIEK